MKQKWKEETSTSPSGRHLDHIKALLVHDIKIYRLRWWSMKQFYSHYEFHYYSRTTSDKMVKEHSSYDREIKG